MTTVTPRKEELTHANCGGQVQAVAITDGPQNLYRCLRCGAQEYKW